MAWPGITDFSEAVQNPHLCFEGEDLEAGSVKLNPRGMPLVYSGAFACVYRVSVGGADYAVRCFTREVVDQQSRYNDLSNYLISVLPPSFVHFSYQEQGIKVRGIWYPIVRMEWVEGEILSKFVEFNLNRPDALRLLAARWRGGTTSSLRGLGIAHNDLQHGNVLVEADGRIRLVDYDGMFLPKFRGEQSPELGHKNYQHPKRGATNYDDYVDNFPALVVYLSLLAIAADPGLWSFHNEDNLIFTNRDYANPRSSKAFNALRNSPDSTVTKLTEKLEECCRLPVEKTPDLETILLGVPVTAPPSTAAAPAARPAAPAAPSPRPTRRKRRRPRTGATTPPAQATSRAPWPTTTPQGRPTPSQPTGHAPSPTTAPQGRPTPSKALRLKKALSSPKWSWQKWLLIGLCLVLFSLFLRASLGVILIRGLLFLAFFGLAGYFLFSENRNPFHIILGVIAVVAGVTPLAGWLANFLSALVFLIGATVVAVAGIVGIIKYIASKL